MEMGMRAKENVTMSTDITPRISPLAAVLHPRFLSTHCSSCFSPLPSSSLCCTSCSSLRYCSAACLAADSTSHLLSHDCRLLSLGQNPHSSSDARAALRLLHSLRSLGSDFQPGTRVGGLLADGVDKVLEEGGELAEKIVEGCALMRRARGTADGAENVLEEDDELAEKTVESCSGGTCADGIEKVIEERRGVSDEVALWVVVMNGVEVQVGEIGSIGVAVYPPGFSWFNHSCCPNAWYRFELNSGGFADVSGCFRVLGVGMGDSRSDGE